MVMRASHGPRKRIEQMARRVRYLKQQARELEQQHKQLALEHYLVACCCELAHWMRTGAMHKGWSSYRDSWLDGELLLLEELNSHLIHDELSNPEQQPQLLEAQEQEEGDERKEQSQEQQVARSLSSDLGSLPLGLWWQQHRECQQQQQAASSMQAQTDSQGADELEEDAVTRVGSNSSSQTAAASAATLIAVPAQEGIASGTSASTSVASAIDPSSLYLSSPGDFLGLFRFYLSLPPIQGADSMSVQDFGLQYKGLYECGVETLSRLQRLEQGEQLTSNEPHPLAVFRDRVLLHGRCLCTVMLLHPDDLLNKFRLLNHETMELVEPDVEKCWERMYEVVDELGFTNQQQHLIAIGCGIFTRLIRAAMEERQQLTQQQQQLLQVKDGRSVDLQQQADCADRLKVLMRKERFLSQCLSAYISSVYNLVQLAKLLTLMWPFAPQMGVVGAVLAQKLQEREEERQQQQQRRRLGLPFSFPAARAVV